MKIIKVSNGNVPFKGPMGPARPYQPSFKGFWYPGLTMVPANNNACTPLKPTKLDYFA